MPSPQSYAAPQACAHTPDHAHSAEALIIPGNVLVRISHDPRRIEGWALVLTSKGLEALVVQHTGSYELHVPAQHTSRALAELAAYDAEERDAERRLRAEPRRDPPATRHAWAGGVAIAVLLCAFYAVTGPRSGGTVWFARGASDASRVLHGEAYRAITALTLHADGAHLVSNVAIAALVIGAVMRSTGVGLGALLVLAAGAAGNLLNAWAHATHHISVGFSTAVFAAIGLLGGLTYTDAQRRARPRHPAWTALAGSVALLAALGASERSDVFAHLFGGVAGMALALVVGFARVRPPRMFGQWLLGAGAAGAVVGAWWLALQ